MSTLREELERERKLNADLLAALKLVEPAMSSLMDELAKTKATQLGNCQSMFG